MLNLNFCEYDGYWISGDRCKAEASAPDCTKSKVVRSSCSDVGKEDVDRREIELVEYRTS